MDKRRDCVGGEGPAADPWDDFREVPLEFFERVKYHNDVPVDSDWRF